MLCYQIFSFSYSGIVETAAKQRQYSTVYFAGFALCFLDYALYNLLFFVGFQYIAGRLQYNLGGILVIEFNKAVAIVFHFHKTLALNDILKTEEVVFTYRKEKTEIGHIAIGD